MSDAALGIAVAVRQAVEFYQASRRKAERREKGRVDFVQTVQVRTEDGKSFTVLTRDLSETGIRLVGTRPLRGQLITVLVPVGATSIEFKVRILWTCPVGEDLVENGGSFLSALAPG